MFWICSDSINRNCSHCVLVMGCSSSNAGNTGGQPIDRSNTTAELRTSAYAENISSEKKKVVQVIADSNGEISGAPKERRGSFVKMMSEKRISEGKGGADNSYQQQRNFRRSLSERASFSFSSADDVQISSKKEMTGGSSQDAGDLEKGSFIRRLSRRTSLNKLFFKSNDSIDDKTEPLSPIFAMLKMRHCELCWVRILSYLSVRSLCVLDSSLTCRELRSELLDSIVRLRVVYFPQCITKPCVQWLARRGLFLGGTIRLHAWEPDATCALVGQRCDPDSVKEVVLKRGCSHMGSLSGLGIIHICAQSPRLTRLDLSECRGVTDVDMARVVDCKAPLRQLSLRGCVLITDATVVGIAGAYSRIECLNLSFCRQITDAALTTLATHHLTSLSSLSILECRKVTNEGVRVLCTGCPGLLEINISYCGRLTDEALVAISQTCPHLRSLSLMGLRHITDVGIAKVAENCHDLRVLDLRRCAGVTDETAAVLAANSPHLQKLYLSECRAITDESLAALAYGCSDLTTLFVGECALITDLGLEALPYGCPKLQILDASYCPQISADTVERLLGEYPSLCIYCNCFHRPENPPELLCIEN